MGMDDKTSSSLQPSTTFGDSSSNTHSQHLPPISTYSSTPLNPTSPTNTQPTTYKMDQKNQLAISNLMSPPEAPLMSSFSPTTADAPIATQSKTPQPGNVLLISPPISPEDLNKTHTAPEDLSRVPIQDPILFPEQGNSSAQPLFVEDAEHQRVVKEHIVARSIEFGTVSPPKPHDYKLALEFKSQVAHLYDQHRGRWQERELAQLREDRAARSRRWQPIAPAAPKYGKPARPSKPTPKAKQPRVSKPSNPKVRAGTPTRQPAREDKDFQDLPDYCPPISSLPNRPNPLKIDWKGAPIDLSSDPHVNLLHPGEVILAATLRLDCATYLTSKRRIFIRRVECVKIRKEFRKTDAQQACKIDVNKASKLWTAFDKVGWLEEKWVKDY